MTLLRPAVAFLAALLSFPAGGFGVGKYAVSQKTVEGHSTYHLLDLSRNMDVGVVPEIGNLVYEFKADGKDVLIPVESFKTYLEKRWFCCGIPFLAPWANRINHDYYYFQDKKYLLNPALGNLLRDQFNQVIHGLLVFDSRWEVAEFRADDSGGAILKARHNFYGYPELMAQFPFAHSYVVTYQLKDGKLGVTTEIHNIGMSAMPVHIAYHPYFRPDGNREDWILSLGAKTHWKLSPQLIPTGETEPAVQLLPGEENFTLGKTFLDDNFSGFERGPDGFGHVSVKGKSEKIEVIYGKEFDFAVVYAPLDSTLICIEPQTGPTNAFNLNHKGKFPGLIVLESGKTFTGSFWIVPSGF